MKGYGFVFFFNKVAFKILGIFGGGQICSDLIG